MTAEGSSAGSSGLADPKMRARLADLGGTPLPGSPAEFGKLIADETEKWGKVIMFAGIKRSETLQRPILHNAPFGETHLASAPRGAGAIKTLGA